MNNLTEEQTYPTPFSASPILPLLMLSLATQRHTPQTKSNFRDEYDYIVVGAGSAGSVVANRLSEVPCVTILLLEAGGPTPLMTEVPSAGRAFLFTDIDWKYRTVSQRYTASEQINRQIIWPLGKTLGGSSAINGLMSVRGNRRNYDQWESMGAKGWNYSEVFRYFMKLEDNMDNEFISSGFHGKGGPITVSHPNYQPEVKAAVREAARSIGYQFVDSNGPTQHGFYDHQATIRRGQRCSTAKAYLVPAENRTNLDILSRARVTKVLIENKKAVGVEFDFGGARRSVRARREVVLSAGAVHTPQILMLSGIGPMSELQRFQIPFVADLPVGQNLQDHCAAILPSVLTNENIQPLEKRMLNRTSMETYISNRTGPLLSTAGIHLTAFLSNNEERAKKDLPDYQLLFVEINSLFIKTNLRYRPEIYHRIFGPHENQPFHFCLSQVLHPRSRGTVRLRSAHPHLPPKIDPNYFSHPQDLVDVVEGLKTCKKILTNSNMQAVGSQLLNATFPSCESFKDDEDLFFTCIARSAVITISHPAGTAKMGDPRDPTTVVDPELRVKSIAGLRVVDASVMPALVWGNTNIPTIMIAEKASDIIKTGISCQNLASAENSSR